MPWPQPRVWGGPSSLGVRAANSLYWLDATADEGAAGRPEVQEGQAGRSGQSGLATGTENRKEMNRVKIGRERGSAKQWGAGRGRRARKSRVGDTEAPRGAPTLGDREAPERGFEAADAAGREEGHGGRRRVLGTGRGKRGRSCQGHSQEERTEDGREGKSQSGKAGPQRPFGLRTPRWLPGKLRPAEHLRATSRPEAGGEG